MLTRILDYFGWKTVDDWEEEISSLELDIRVLTAELIVVKDTRNYWRDKCLEKKND